MTTKPALLVTHSSTTPRGVWQLSAPPLSLALCELEVGPDRGVFSLSQPKWLLDSETSHWTTEMENVPQCRLLEEEIRRIDASARNGMSAQSQEWLRVRRREVNDEMWRLKCGF